MTTTADRLRILNGVGVKTPVACCTTGNITLAGLQTIDGVALAAGQRVLVASQDNADENGIYAARVDNWARVLDFTSAADLADGTMVYVADGFIYGGVLFSLDPT